jgi:hypothetical protein
MQGKKWVAIVILKTLRVYQLFYGSIGTVTMSTQIPLMDGTSRNSVQNKNVFDSVPVESQVFPGAGGFTGVASWFRCRRANGRRLSSRSTGSAKNNRQSTLTRHRCYYSYEDLTVEDYPSGYPRFSSFIAVDNAFNLCRRFTVVRARLLLIKQDRVCVLEEELRKLDEEEQRLLFLGSIRRDKNADRHRTLQELDEALADYGKELSLWVHV